MRDADAPRQEGWRYECGRFKESNVLLTLLRGWQVYAASDFGERDARTRKSENEGNGHARLRRGIVYPQDSETREMEVDLRSWSRSNNSGMERITLTEASIE